MEKQDKPIDLEAERKKRRQIFSRVRAYLTWPGHSEKIFDSADPPPEDDKQDDEPSK